MKGTEYNYSLVGYNKMLKLDKSCSCYIYLTDYQKINMYLAMASRADALVCGQLLLIYIVSWFVAMVVKVM